MRRVLRTTAATDLEEFDANGGGGCLGSSGWLGRTAGDIRV